MNAQFDPDEVGRWLASQSRRIHMVGIGGVGMAGLAHILQAAGHQVSGTDQQLNPWTQHLEDDGVRVTEGHGVQFLNPVLDMCIHTTAVASDHEEVRVARERGARVLRRGEVLAALSHRRGSIAISGTHGKTTTSSMTHFLLSRMGQEPDYFIGAQPAHAQRVAGWSGSPFFCFEADESDGTLVHYRPETMVITNIDFDHMEHHANEESFFDMFQTVVNRTEKTVIAPVDDAFVKRLSWPGHLQVFPVGLGEGAGLRATIQDHEEAYSVSRFVLHGEDLGTFKLGVPGLHNVRNALAALGVIDSLGLSVGEAAFHLKEFRATGRRMECLLRNNQCAVYTDYAHHPTEIAAVMDTVETWPAQRILVVFQPHRYTRTLALRDDFATVLKRADVLLLAPVYAASEEPILGGSTEDLERAVSEQTSGTVIRVSQMNDLQDAVVDIQQEGDLILFLGAGDIDDVARQYANQYSEE